MRCVAAWTIGAIPATGEKTLEINSSRRRASGTKGQRQTAHVADNSLAANGCMQSRREQAPAHVPGACPLSQNKQNTQGKKKTRRLGPRTGQKGGEASSRVAHAVAEPAGGRVGDAQAICAQGRRGATTAPQPQKKWPLFLARNGFRNARESPSTGPHVLRSVARRNNSVCVVKHGQLGGMAHLPPLYTLNLAVL